jgi:hypothetical protein
MPDEWEQFCRHAKGRSEKSAGPCKNHLLQKSLSREWLADAGPGLAAAEHSAAGAILNPQRVRTPPALNAAQGAEFTSGRSLRARPVLLFRQCLEPDRCETGDYLPADIAAAADVATNFAAIGSVRTCEHGTPSFPFRIFARDDPLTMVNSDEICINLVQMSPRVVRYLKQLLVDAAIAPYSNPRNS